MASFLNSQQAASYLQVGISTLAKMRTAGTGPNHMKFGRTVRYAKEDLEEWAKEQRRSAHPNNGNE